MANIPVYDRATVAPEVGPVPNVMVNVEHQTAAAGASQAFGQVTDVATQAYHQEKRKAEASLLAGKEANLSSGLDELFYGSTPGQQGQGDPAGKLRQNIESAFSGGKPAEYKPGLKSAVGESAIPAADTFYSKAGELRQRIGETIEDPQLRQAYEARSSGVLQSYRHLAEEHVAQQVQVSQQARVKALLDQSLSTIGANPDDDSIVARSTAQPEAFIKARALNPEDAAADVRAWRAQAFETAINGRLDHQNYSGAEALFARPDVREALGARAGHIQKVLETARDKVGGLADAQKLLHQASTSTAGGLLEVDQSKLFVGLDQLPPGQRREIAQQELTRITAEVKRANDQTKEEWFQKAYSQYYAGGQRLSAIDPRVLTLLRDEDSEGHHKLMSIIQGDESHARSGRMAQTQEQLAAFTVRINDMSSNPEKYRGMDATKLLREDLPAMGQPLFKQVAERLASINKTPLNDPPLPDLAVQAVRETVQDAVGASKDQWTKWNDVQKRVFFHALTGVQQDAAAWTRANGGKQPGPEQYEVWARKRMEKVPVEGGGYFGTNLGNEVPRAQYEVDPKFQGKKVVGEPEGVPAKPQAPQSAIPAPVIKTGKSGNKFALNPKTGKWQSME
jgi:hypothetical protein